MALEAEEEEEEKGNSGEDEGLDQVAAGERQVAGEVSATAWLSSSSIDATAKIMAHAVFRTGLKSSEFHKIVRVGRRDAVSISHVIFPLYIT